MAIKVLFVCVHNSARSQMAEAFLKQIGGSKFEAASAGLEPGTLHPLAVEVMREIGIDISKNRTKDVFEFLRQGCRFDYVITVCEAAAAGRCPVFPGVKKKIHWAFEDPSLFTGTRQKKLDKTRALRDAIKAAVERFVAVDIRAAVKSI